MENAASPSRLRLKRSFPATRARSRAKIAETRAFGAALAAIFRQRPGSKSPAGQGPANSRVIHENDRSAVLFQHFHDFRLVRPFARLQAEATLGCNSRELGDRVLRVLPASARQSNRLRLDEPWPIEDPSRGHHDARLRGLFILLHEKILEPGLPLGKLMYVGCGLFRFPKSGPSVSWEVTG